MFTLLKKIKKRILLYAWKSVSAQMHTNFLISVKMVKGKTSKKNRPGVQSVLNSTRTPGLSRNALTMAPYEMSCWCLREMFREIHITQKFEFSG